MLVFYTRFWFFGNLILIFKATFFAANSRIIAVKIPDFIVLKYFCTMRKIKMIWDFRGPAAAKTAEHHEVHLKEFIAIKKLPLEITGFEIKTDMHAIAFMVVTDSEILADALAEPALCGRRGDWRQGLCELQGERPNLWRSPRLA